MDREKLFFVAAGSDLPKVVNREFFKKKGQNDGAALAIFRKWVT